MTKLHMARLVAGVGTLATLWPAAAQLTLTLQPGSTTTSVGGTTSVEVLLSGLDAPPGVAGFSVGLSYEGTIVSPITVAYGTGLGDVVTDEDLAANPLFVSAVSLDLDPGFFATQPASFVLATLTFEGLALGTSALTFDPDLTALTDENANSLDFTTSGGEIVVVPEPGQAAGMAFMLAAAVGLVVFQRRHQAK